MTNKVKNKGGRPTVMTEEVLHKLEEAFELDCSDEQACFHAGIGTSTLYNYQKKNPEFVERKSLLRTTLTIKAKMAIAKALEDGDVKVSMWILERLEPETYSLKHILKREPNKDEDYNQKVIFITKEDKEQAYEHIKSVIGEENM
jgi:hypothetical protein